MSDHRMSQQPLEIARRALQAIGYRDQLLLPNYPFAMVSGSESTGHIDLAAFALDPPSYRSSCIGVALITGVEPQRIQQYRALGAPQIFTIQTSTGDVDRWKMTARGLPTHLDRFSVEHFDRVLWENQETWNPQSILRAKAIALNPGARQLDFFDAGLIPTLEETVHKKLDILLNDVIAKSKVSYQEHHTEPLDYPALFRLIFRFIAAKLLADRQHPGLWTDPDPQATIAAVEAFYFQDEQSLGILQDPRIQQLAWDQIRTSFHFQNISVEALAYVYENTFVNPTIRELQDIHATPHGITEYVVQHLPFESLDPEQRHVFEPFAGHAPFLIAALGRLRTLLGPDIGHAARHDYFQRMLSGIEIDSFAREIARYSLILADYPNPNGWRIEQGDAFTSPIFETLLAQANIVVFNPPYSNFTAEERQGADSALGATKAVTALQRVLQRPPALLGCVLPRVVVNGPSFLTVRQELIANYQTIEVVGLPDNVFRHSESETVLILAAHTKEASSSRLRTALVEGKDYQHFIQTGQPTWETGQPLDTSGNAILWHTPLTHVWEALSDQPRLRSIADVHRGIEYNISLKTNKVALVADQPRPGFVPGLMAVADGFKPYMIYRWRYLHIDPSLMRTYAHHQLWDRPKVIANAARLNRGHWPIAGAVDEQGLVCSQRFLGIWPTADLPVELIAAVLNGPVANAFVSTARTARDNQVRTVRDIPIPQFTTEQIQVITGLVREYRSYLSQWHARPQQEELFKQLCYQTVLLIDAAVLAAYNLPVHLERELLDYFAGYRRPGPVDFDHYYPSGIPSTMSLQTYIAELFPDAWLRPSVDMLADELRDAFLATGETLGSLLSTSESGHA